MQKIFLSEAQKQAGWKERKYVPHYDAAGLTQLITFRLNDSLPRTFLEELKTELAWMDERDADNKRREIVEAYLDKGAGDKCLQDPRVAVVIANSLEHFHQVRYCLHAWVVMPNHVHVLLSPNADEKIAEIIRSWKGFTARTANRILGRTGVFWQRDYHDRFIRDADHFFTALNYIENNPVKAGLCKAPGDWEFSSAGYRRAGKGY